MKKVLIAFGMVSALAIAGCAKPILRGPEISHYTSAPSSYRLVEVMSGKDNGERTKIVKTALSVNNIPFSVQSFVHQGSEGNNIVVEYGEKPKTLLVAAHFDRRKGTPGANDNASCVSAAISALQTLRDVPPLKNIGVRFLFTDKEESQGNGSKNNLWGARAYIEQNAVDDLAGVVSFEMCGVGEAFGIWDVRDELGSSAIVKALQEAGKKENIYNGTIGVIPRNYSDHRAFYEQGIPSVGVTIIPKSDEKILREYIMNPNGFKWLNVSNRPKVFQTYHSEADVPETLEPVALELASRIIVRTIQEFDRLSGGT